jgi:hypothetical protein
MTLAEQKQAINFMNRNLFPGDQFREQDFPLKQKQNFSRERMKAQT